MKGTGDSDRKAEVVIIYLIGQRYSLIRFPKSIAARVRDSLSCWHG